MNKLDLENKRLENWHKLDTMPFRPKYNAVEVDINNSLAHELAKFMCVWLIRNGIPANLLQDSLKWDKLTKGEIDWKNVPLQEFAKLAKILGQKFKHEWERPVVITEARFKKAEQKDFCYDLKTPMKQQTRRADIFILDTGEMVEIETNHKVKKGGDNVITVYI